jgi:GDPmannose 4,6-dehydratase
VVTGAGGQDGYFLTDLLLAHGWTVHAVVRSRSQHLEQFRLRHGDRLRISSVDLYDPRATGAFLRSVQPAELYNLAGASSVSESFDDPERAWRTNAALVFGLLEAVRMESPESRIFQASSSEMFGCPPGGSIVHDERSALAPQSPYGAAKAAAHLMCRAYRDSFGLRLASGILFNHESHRRPAPYLTRKVVDHALAARRSARGSRTEIPPLALGHLKIRRDWGFARDFVDGMVDILRQVEIRPRVTGRPGETDVAAVYRDYVVCTGVLHCVWELVDRVFARAGFDLAWNLDGEDPRLWGAVFAGTARPAVVVDAALLRPADPLAIAGDPSRAIAELGWRPRYGLDPFLDDMFAAAGDR